MRSSILSAALLSVLGFASAAHATTIAGTYTLGGPVTSYNGYSINLTVTIDSTGKPTSADVTYNNPAYAYENPNFTSISNYYQGGGQSGSQIYQTNVGALQLYFLTTPDTGAMAGDLNLCTTGVTCGTQGTGENSYFAMYQYYNPTTPPYGATVPGFSVNLTGDYLVPQGQSSPAAVPEPSSLMLLGTGLVGVAGAARRRFLKA